MAEVSYTPTVIGNVRLDLTVKEAQDIFNYLYRYDTSEGFISRGNIVQALLKSGAVTVEN